MSCLYYYRESKLDFDSKTAPIGLPSFDDRFCFVYDGESKFYHLNSFNGEGFYEDDIDTLRKAAVYAVDGSYIEVSDDNGELIRFAFQFGKMKIQRAEIVWSDENAVKAYDRLRMGFETKLDILFEAMQKQLDIPKEQIQWGDVADLCRASEALDEFMKRMGDIWR